MYGCSNPVCDAEILDRLNNECKLRIGEGNPMVCGTFPDLDPNTGDSPSFRALRAELCEINDPQGFDVECLKGVSCIDLENGACRIDASSTAPTPGESACRMGCSDRHHACEEGCGGGTHHECTDCIVRCLTAREDCVNACG